MTCSGPFDGVLKTISNVTGILALKLTGMDVMGQTGIDKLMAEMMEPKGHGQPTFSTNAILVVPKGCVLFPQVP